MRRARSFAWRWAFERNGLPAHMTLRLTSPQAAMVSRQAALIACIVRRKFDLMTPWNWNVARVVSRSVPLA